MPKIEFATEMDVSEFSPAFLENFFQKIFDMSFADTVYVSMESSCMDFDALSTPRDILTAIEREYHVDCSHIKHLNLYQVLKRVWDAGRRNL